MRQSLADLLAPLSDETRWLIALDLCIALKLPFTVIEVGQERRIYQDGRWTGGKYTTLSTPFYTFEALCEVAADGQQKSEGG